MPLLALLLPALVPILAPVFGDAVRSVVGWVTGDSPAAPKTVDEQVKLMAAENERLKALAELDKPSENISRWVADLRGSFRYLSAGIIILGSMPLLYMIFTKAAQPDDVVFIKWYMENLLGPVFSFMFGARVQMSLRVGK